ncbi:MAG: DNA polymerase III subunit gamma/tau [Endomicrobiaceae bacterium]|nr:DNA polymerase III subunit gamma/tau [Endomicrobiaceae bacterium]
MSYLVLARKFRPAKFSEVVGQNHISQTLKNAITENKVAHAYIFSGPRGTGKTTMARIFAKALNCQEGISSEPCGKCKNCLEIGANQSLDVLEIDGASNNRIDEIREIRDNVKFGAMSSRYKIYIIDEFHRITPQAFDALLKTLEEPPPHVIFILATTELQKAPSTILSRCQKYRFRLLSAKEITEAIQNIAKKDDFEIDDGALEIIVNSAGGSMRDALSLLDQAISSSNGKITFEYMRNLLGLLPKEIIAQTTEDIASNNVESLLRTCRRVYEDGYNILQFAKDLRDHLRQLMIYSVNPEIADISTNDKNLYNKQKTLFTISRFIRLGNLISKVLEEMKEHDQPRILLEIYLLKMAEPYYNVGELISKVDEISKTGINMVNDTKELTNQVNDVDDDAVEQNIDVSTMSETTDYDLLSISKNVICEVAQKHPIRAPMLNSAQIKILNNNAIQLLFKDKYDFNMVKSYDELIKKLISRKIGREIGINMGVDENISVPDEDIVAKPEPEQPKETFVVVEDLKETAKTAMPVKIENIAKKFAGKTIKKKNNEQREKIGTNNSDFSHEQPEE